MVRITWLFVPYISRNRKKRRYDKECSETTVIYDNTQFKLIHWRKSQRTDPRTSPVGFVLLGHSIKRIWAGFSWLCRLWHAKICTFILGPIWNLTSISQFRVTAWNDRVNFFILCLKWQRKAWAGGHPPQNIAPPFYYDRKWEVILFLLLQICGDLMYLSPEGGRFNKSAKNVGCGSFSYPGQRCIQLSFVFSNHIDRPKITVSFTAKDVRTRTVRWMGKMH